MACRWIYSWILAAMLLAGFKAAAAPGEPATEPTAAATLSDADFEQHAQALKARLPGGFAVIVERPFVVIGDEPEATVRLRSRQTIRWAVDRLKQDFFDRDPQRILDIYLFKDEESYRRYAKELFGDDPTTPYGYYSPPHQALIMNIATGGGTLVHEIVHPFMQANFPECPPWLNEGLGSLYEQCQDNAGHIHGLTNWRLAGLQEAIERKQTVPLERLLRMSHREFYGQGQGLHYAQARYLCYYLQQRGLLVRFFRELLPRQAEDPSGLDTLKRVLGESDVPAFQKRWEGFVTELQFP